MSRSRKASIKAGEPRRHLFHRFVQEAVVGPEGQDHAVGDGVKDRVQAVQAVLGSVAGHAEIEAAGIDAPFMEFALQDGGQGFVPRQAVALGQAVAKAGNA